MDKDQVIEILKKNTNHKNVEGMARFGINTRHALGISIPFLRKLGKQIGKNHKLALKLWATDIHEARLLATFIDDPLLVSEKQMEIWVNDFDSWDICDQVCSNLFDKTPYAYVRITDWCRNQKEFVRRAGFVMMAALSVHDKKADNNKFISFFPIIVRYATDERNFVKKAVNWALRQIGKRNHELLPLALQCAEKIKHIDSKSAKWIANDAIRELSKH